MALDLHDIPVYPEFRKMATFKSRLTDCPWICEDDDGRIAFISQEGKDAFFARKESRKRLYASRRKR